MTMPMIQGQDTEYKPWGGLAGIMTGEREGLQHFANLQGLEESQLSNILKRVEASRAANDFSDPRMEMLRQQGIMGDNMSKSAQGQMAMGTLDTGIGAKNAANRAAQSGSEIDSMINSMDQSLAMIQANGPAGMAMVMQGMPPQLRQIMEQAGPQAPQVLMKLSEMLKQQRMNDPKHLANRDLEQLKFGLGTSRDASLQSQKAADDMAKAKFEKAADAARQREHDANLKAIEQSKQAAQDKIKSLENVVAHNLNAANNEPDPIKQEAYKKRAKQAYDMMIGVKQAAIEAKGEADAAAIAAMRGGDRQPKPQQGNQQVINLD